MIDTTFLNEQELRVLDFAKKAHGDQKRKYTGEPYWHHLVRVARLVKPHDNYDGALTIVALLHDVLEDTHIDRVELRKKLKEMAIKTPRHPKILDIVVTVKRLSGNIYDKNQTTRSERKTRQAIDLWGASDEVKTVKYADIIDNISSIVQLDPLFAATYLKEKDWLLQGLVGGNWRLYKLALYHLQKAEIELANQPTQV